MDDEMIKDPQFPEADLARLADGSLPAQRQAELRDELASSPKLASALADQERAIALLRSTDEVRAPDSLRQRIEQQAATAHAPRKRTWAWLGPRLAIPSVTALAAAAAVAVVLITGGGTSAPTLTQTTHLALAAARFPAPAESKTSGGTLQDSIAGISFPYWGDKPGWNAVGARADRVAGRDIATVYYRGQDGTRVGYTIVDGAPVHVSGGTTVVRDGVRFTLLKQGDARLVTWLRSGHTCVIAGRSVSNWMLLRLATFDLRA